MATSLPPDVELLYEITLIADDLLSQAARSGRIITQVDMKDCVTACVHQIIPGDTIKQERFIQDILAYQINDDVWLPNMEEPAEE